ncbi:cohesin complex subunit [Tieghemiomyces parasiticus]|uniref:Cohesin complex subunit n=1 Tax=Tieghemiomyces parasiticus TaxID=78921 RepID=A0A9W8E201_9FUNG|nr:cohesin complex subunit [Tieghemiomyces parasiticus]
MSPTPRRRSARAPAPVPPASASRPTNTRDGSLSTSSLSSLDTDSEEESNPKPARSGRGSRGRGRAPATKRARTKTPTAPRSLWDAASLSQLPSVLTPRNNATVATTTAKRRRPASTARRRKSTVSGAVPVHNDNESALFDAVMDKDTALAAVVSDWIDSYTADAPTAFQELINFLMRACGCHASVGGADFSDETVVTAVLADLQERLRSDVAPDFPMQSRAKLYRKFSQQCLDFVTGLIKQGQHVLVYTGDFMDVFGLWIAQMAGSTSRPFRYTSTLVALTTVTALCDLSQSGQTTLATTHRQLTAAKAKRGRGAGPSAARIKQLEQTIASLNAQAVTIAALLGDWYDTIFIHRFRDMDPHIRQECLRALATWIIKLPGRFLSDDYLRIFGWLMSDKVAGVRQEAVAALARLYGQPDLRPGLHLFTKRFAPRIAAMALYDADVTGVRLAALQLFTALHALGLAEVSAADLLALPVAEDEQGTKTETAEEESAATSRTMTRAVLSRYQLDLGGTEVIRHPLCICSTAPGEPHGPTCHDARLVQRVLGDYPLQALFIPTLLHTHPRVRAAVAPLVAGWVRSVWVPALAGASDEADPLTMDYQALTASEASDSDDDSDDGADQASDIDDGESERPDAGATLGTLTKYQQRTFRTYHALALLLEAFTTTGRSDTESPDVTVVGLQPTEIISPARHPLDLRVCAATHALAAELTELGDWRSLCTYAGVDHSVSSSSSTSDEPDAVAPAPDPEPHTSPTRSDRRRRSTRPALKATAPTTTSSVASPDRRIFHLTEAQETVFLDLFVEALRAVCQLPDTAAGSVAGIVTVAGIVANGPPPVPTPGSAAAATVKASGRERRKHAEQLQRLEDTINRLSQRLVPLLPRLLQRYRADGPRIAKVLGLVTGGVLGFHAYLDGRRVPLLRELVTETRSLFFRHRDPLVLDQTLTVLLLAVASGLFQEGGGGERVVTNGADEAAVDFAARLTDDATFNDVTRDTLQQVYTHARAVVRPAADAPLALAVVTSPDQTSVRDLAVALYRLGQLAQLAPLDMFAFRPTDNIGSASPTVGTSTTMFRLASDDATVDPESLLGPLGTSLLELVHWDIRIPRDLGNPAAALIPEAVLSVLTAQFLWQVGQTRAQAQDAPADVTELSDEVTALNFVRRYLAAQCRAWLDESASVAAPPGLAYRLIQHAMFQSQSQLLWLLSSDVTHPTVCPALARLREGVDESTQAAFTAFIRATLAHWLEVEDTAQGITDGLTEDPNEDPATRMDTDPEDPPATTSSDVPAWDAHLLAQARQSVALYLQGFQLQLFNVADLTSVLIYHGLLDPVYDDLVKAACEAGVRHTTPQPTVPLTEYYHILKYRQGIIEVFAQSLSASYALWMDRCRHLPAPTPGLARMLAHALKDTLTAHPDLPIVESPAPTAPDATPLRQPDIPTPAQQRYQLYRVVTSAVHKLHQEGITFALIKFKGYFRLENFDACRRTLKYFKALVLLITGLLSPFQAEALQKFAAEAAVDQQIMILSAEAETNEEDETGPVTVGDLTAKDWEPYHQYLRRLQTVVEKGKLQQISMRSAVAPGSMASVDPGTPTAPAGTRRNLRRQLNEAVSDHDDSDEEGIAPAPHDTVGDVGASSTAVEATAAAADEISETSSDEEPADEDTMALDADPIED